MREIKFRGKTRDGKWIYGSLVMQNGKASIYQDLAHPDREIFLIQVDPETVDQYTGLKDNLNKGKMIYERDIYRFDGIIGIIVYNHAKFQWFNGIEFNDINTYGEVIGNIHDNPELWEKS